jgi:hypothetical protein
MLIACNGMMRAGSTLQYNIVLNLIEHMDLGVGQGFFQESQFSNLETQFDQWAKDPYYHVIKLHEICPKSLEMVASDRMKICYIFRDIRDVAVSVKRKFSYKRTDHFIGTLDRAVSTYYEMNNIPGVLWQKYEDVITNLTISVREIGFYLGLDATEDVILAVAKSCSLDQAIKTIENMSLKTRFMDYTNKHFLPKINRLAKQFPENLKYILRKTPLHVLRQEIESPKHRIDKHNLFQPSHISKDRGAAGLWRSHLDAKEIGMLSERYKSWYVDAGYDQ